MEMTHYCDGLASELTTWKGRLYDVVTKLDSTSCGEKQYVVPQVNDLHIIIEEMGDKIQQLRTECSAEFTSQGADLEGRSFHSRRTWVGVWDSVSPGEIGG